MALDIVGVFEASEILGLKPASFSHLRARSRSIEGSSFPEAAAELRMGPVWYRKDIAKFAKEYRANRRPPVEKRAEATPAPAPTVPPKKVPAKKAPAKTVTAAAIAKPVGKVTPKPAKKAVKKVVLNK